jgi:ABC-type antimicrobial peptide transport system permease subunit
VNEDHGETDVSPLTCGVRAVIGGAVLYVVAKIASRIVLGIMADAILRGSLQRKDLTNHVGEDRQ